MDAPAESTPRPRRTRRQQTCPNCSEVFINADDFQKHVETCQPAAAAPEPEPTPEPAPPAEEAPAPTTRRRARTAVAETSADAQLLAPEPTNPTAARPTPAVPAAQTSSDFTVPVNQLNPQMGDHDLGDAGLGPLQWEPEPSGPSVFVRAYGVLEDFSEWTVLGAQKVLSIFGLSMVSAFGIFVRGLIVLALAFVLLFAGMFVGKRFGPALTGDHGQEPPIIPPARVVESAVPDIPKQASQVVQDFYSALDKKSYSLAYDCLSPSWQSELPYKSFEKGYSQNQSVQCSIKTSTQQSDSKVSLDVQVDTVEAGKTQSYLFRHQIQKIEGVWKITSGEEVKPSSTPAPTK